VTNDTEFVHAHLTKLTKNNLSAVTSNLQSGTYPYIPGINISTQISLHSIYLIKMQNTTLQ